MSSIKRRLRKHEKPLQQLIKRCSEIDNSNFLLSQHNDYDNTSYVCKYLHNNGPIPDNFNISITCNQYSMISNGKFTINCKDNNNCCILKNNIYAIIVNIIQKRNKDIFIIGKKLKYIKDVYELPCKSSDFGIKVMTIDNNNIFYWQVTDILCKAWKIPYENDRNTFAIFPLNHAI